MNTPTHMIISYALLRHGARKKSDHWWIVVGGVLPDAMIFVLFFYALLFGIPMQEVWDVLYFTDFWQDLIDCFNSIPVLIVIGIGAFLLKWRGGILLSASMFIHILGDIFLHNDDAHRHFFPLSDYKLLSPVSYWTQHITVCLVGVSSLPYSPLQQYFSGIQSHQRSGASRLLFIPYLPLAPIFIFFFPSLLLKIPIKV